MSPMRPRLAKWVAWSLCALAVALSLGTIPLVIAVVGAASAPDTLLPPGGLRAIQQQSLLDWVEWAFGIVAFLSFSGLGALIVSRYPSHLIGWIFCALGFLGALEPFAAFYAIFTLFVVPGALPGGLVAGWLQNWIWVISGALFGAFLPLLFPTGRLVSKRWRPAWWLAMSAMVSLALGAAFHAGPLFNNLDTFDVPNPFGVTMPGLGDLVFVLSTVPFALLLTSMLLAAVSVVVRLRRAQGAERRQIKWFAYFGALLALLFVVQGVVRYILDISSPTFEVALNLAWFIASIGFSMATGLALLKYHLYDIDLIIRLTLVYGTLTTVLAGGYVSLVLAGQAVVQALIGERGQQPAVIVASTLLVAALVTPLRRAIQAAVDRRFFRRKADAERTLAAFGDTLRQEVDLEQLSARLVAVVQETMQPEHASLWLRPSHHAKRPPVPPRRVTAQASGRFQAEVMHEGSSAGSLGAQGGGIA
jgi:hypothetical protein